MNSCYPEREKQIQNIMSVNFYKDKKTLVTGARGMIGKELVELLHKYGAKVFVVDLRNGVDLRYFENSLRITKGMEYVFHLAGIKGSPVMTQERPVDFMAPMLQFGTNMITASSENEVKRFLYTSSIAVLNPETDKFPAWAKQTGESLIS